MGSRYNKNEVKLKDGKRVLSNQSNRKIPFHDGDIYIITQTGDRLDTISSEFYGDPAEWWIIAVANNIGNPAFALPDGTELRIPFNMNLIK